MNSSASFVGTTHTGTKVIDSISSTAGLKVGMPIQTTDLPAGATIASITSSTAITSSVNATTGHASATITYQGYYEQQYFPNPNPAAGLVMVQFKNNFNYYLGGFSGFVSPVGSPTTSTTSGLTAGAAYVITVLGNTTLAEWQTIGLPPGFTPTVGQTIVVPSGVTGTGGGHTGKVGIPGVSGVTSIEAMGDPNQLLNNSNIASNAGAVMTFQFLAPTISTGAYIAPMIPTAPANNTVVGMTFYFDGSSVTVDGI